MFVNSASLIVLSMFGPGEISTEPAYPKVYVECREPDWLELTNGNWSPWYVDENGQRLWNPTRGYNAWIDSIPDDQKAWLDHADLFWGLWSQINPYAFTGYPDDDTRDDDENGIPDRVEIDEALDSFDFETYIARVKEISQKPYLGAPMLDHMSDEIVAIILKYGIDDQALPYDPEGDDKHNPAFIHSVGRSGYSFPFSGSRWIQTTLLEYLAEHNRGDEYAKLFTHLLPLHILRNEDSSMLGGMHVYASLIHFTGYLNWHLYAYPDLLSVENLELIHDALTAHERIPLGCVTDIVAIHDSARYKYDSPEFGGGKDEINYRLTTPYDDLAIEIQEMLAAFEGRMTTIVVDADVHRLDGTRPSWHREGYEDQQFPSGRKLKKPPFGYNAYYHRNINMARQYRAMNQAARMYIDATRHKHRHGSFPSTLEEFDADLINFEHHDPFVRGGLLYRLHGLLARVRQR